MTETGSLVPLEERLHPDKVSAGKEKRGMMSGKVKGGKTRA